MLPLVLGRERRDRERITQTSTESSYLCSGYFLAQQNRGNQNNSAHLNTMKGIILFLFYISSALKAVTVTAQPQSRHLPEKVLVAYTTNKCHDLDQMGNVTKAIEDGVNVLIWGFHSFFADETTKLGLASDLNVEKFIAYKKSLQQMGHGNVLHLVSFGGWDGKHLPSGVTSDELHDMFQAYNTQQNTLENETLFDGIDWDLEGNDNITSPLNEFTVECLDQMGELSHKVKEDGLIVSMVSLFAQDYFFVYYQFSYKTSIHAFIGATRVLFGHY